MLINNGQLNIALNLYLGGFDKKNGTLFYISKCLGDTSGHTRTFLKKLTKLNILVESDYKEIDGRVYPVYSLDKEKLLEEMKDIDIFRKISAILYDDWKTDNPFGAFPVYDKKELEKMEEIIK